MDVASGTTVAAVLVALRRAVLVGDASVVDFGSLVRDACLVGEAGPDFVGEAGLTGRADGTFLPVDDGGHGTVWGRGRRWVVSWRVFLSRAVLMMTDTPAVLLCLGSVLKCVFSLPVTSIFMLFSMTASSVTQGWERMSCAVYRASALTCSIFPISSLAESVMLSQ